MNRNIVKIYATLFIMLSSVVLITDCCSSRSMPKSRPRPVSHFRGVITTSSAKITTTTSTGGSSSHGNLNLNNGNSGGGGGGSQDSSSATATFTLITTKTAIVGESPAQETTSTVTDPRSGPGPGGTSSSSSSSSSSDQRHQQPNAANKDQLMRMGKCSLLFEENYCLNGGKCYNFTIANSTMPTCECADGFMGERCESKYLDGTYLSMRKSKIHIETASIYYGAFLALIAVLVLLYFLHCFQTGPGAKSSGSSSSCGSGSKQLLLKKSKKVVS